MIYEKQHYDEIVLQNNILSLYAQASRDIIEQGKMWYPTAHDYTFELACEFMLTHNQIIGITSALSPRCEWELNKRRVKQYLLHGSVGATEPMLDKIKRILSTEDGKRIVEILNGPKTQNFYWNIKYPNNENYVTIDTHAIRAAILDLERKTDGRLSIKEYNQFSSVYKNVAKKVNLLPSELQAIVWLQVKNLYNL